jgi:hypothetical protein
MMNNNEGIIITLTLHLCFYLLVVLEVVVTAAAGEAGGEGW